MNHLSHSQNRRVAPFSIFLIVFGVIGWYASFSLLTEYVHTLQDPHYVPNCDISPLVTCGPNMGSWQGSVFGFSNTIIGVAAFVAPIIVGAALLAGARFSSWFWWLFNLGNLGGIVFVFWLSWQSVFRLGTLCPWCMVVWTVTIPLFWVCLGVTTSRGWAKLPGGKKTGVFISQWAWVFIVFSFFAIALMAQLGVDWLTHLRLSL